MRSLNIHNIKSGDTVLVDVEFANGGYEAEIITIGKVFAKIKSGESEWDIMIDRLTPKKIY